MSAIVYYIIFLSFAELLRSSELPSIPTEELKDGQKNLTSEHPTNVSNSVPHIPTTTLETECKSDLCLWKCCAQGKHLNKTGKCTKSEYEVKLQIPLPPDAPEYYNNLDFQFSRVLNCPTPFLLDPNEDAYDLSKNGTLNVLGFGQFNVSEYCFEYHETYNTTTAMICDKTETPPPTDSHTNLKYFAIGNCCSIFFLVLTLIAHILIPQLRQPTYSKYLQCHILSLTLQYICLLILQQVEMTRGFLCASIGYCTQFFVLTSFFWLNAMCIDMWLSFRNKTFAGSMFLRYSFYALGVPLIISLITVLAQFFINVNIFGYSLKPDVGVYSCLIKDQMAKFFYFYFFILIILIVNLYLFIDMAISIFKIQGTYENTSRRPNFDKQQRTKFFLFLALFLIMGLNWFTEILSFLFMQSGGIWFITDILNTFHGVFIFAIVVCKRRILYLLNKKLCPSKICIRGTNEGKEEHTFESKFPETIVENDRNSKTETADLMN